MLRPDRAAGPDGRATEAGTAAVVIGLGSPLMGDDGLGLVVLKQLRQHYDIRPSLELVDGGTWGMNLLPVVEGADRLLLLDAIDTAATPGAMVELRDQAIPRWLSHKVSPHQIDFREVLALAELRGTLPRRMIALGVQPARVAMSTELSDVVAARVPEVVRQAREILMRWGFLSRSRPVSAHA